MILAEAMKYSCPGLLHDKTTAGSVRWRVRVGGDRNRKTKVPVGTGEPGFDGHYHAARSGDVLETIRPARVRAGTLDELCGKYHDALTDKVQGGTASSLTHKRDRSLLTSACNLHDDLGDRLGCFDADMPREDFTLKRDSFESMTGAADNCIKVLRAVYRWGEERGYPANSPVYAIKKVNKNRGGASPWSVPEMKQFLARHKSGSWRNCSSSCRSIPCPGLRMRADWDKSIC